MDIQVNISPENWAKIKLAAKHANIDVQELLRIAIRLTPQDIDTLGIKYKDILDGLHSSDSQISVLGYMDNS